MDSWVHKGLRTGLPRGGEQAMRHQQMVMQLTYVITVSISMVTNTIPLNTINKSLFANSSRETENGLESSEKGMLHNVKRHT